MRVMTKLGRSLLQVGAWPNDLNLRDLSVPYKVDIPVIIPFNPMRLRSEDLAHAPFIEIVTLDVIRIGWPNSDRRESVLFVPVERLALLVCKPTAINWMKAVVDNAIHLYMRPVWRQIALDARNNKEKYK